ncbi:MAG: hypothetical protein ABIP29_12050 [Candidatus Eisenbacteria bacterium]
MVSRPLPARLVLVLALALALLTPPASAAPVHGSFAYDYRNTPTVAPLLDRELVILSARGYFAPGRVDSLHAAGVKPYVIVQPNQAWRLRGVAIGAAPGDDRTFPWDTATYRLARRHDAILRDSTGISIDMFGGVSWSSMVLDFGNREFAREYAALLVATFPRAAGVLLDYGCPWIPVALPDWASWRAGWIGMLEEVRRRRPDLALISQCDQWTRDLPVDGILLERVGSALNPPARSFATARALRAAGKRVFFRQESTDAGTRRFFAGTALVFDGAFDQCADPNQVPPLHRRNVEHFELAGGPAAGDAWESSPGIWQRMTKRGLVIVNASARPHTYRDNATTAFVIPAGDALLIQYRDHRGRLIKARSNAGR